MNLNMYYLFRTCKQNRRVELNLYSLVLAVGVCLSALAFQVNASIDSADSESSIKGAAIENTEKQSSNGVSTPQSGKDSLNANDELALGGDNLILDGLNAELESLSRANDSQGTIAIIHQIIAHHQKEGGRSKTQESLLYSGLAVAYLKQGRTESASHYIEKALGIAREIGNSKLAAAILNDKGKIFAVIGDNVSATKAFRASANLAKGNGLIELTAIAETNLAKAFYDAEERTAFVRALGHANESVDKLPRSITKGNLKNSVGNMYAKSVKEFGAAAAFRLDAMKAFQSALAIGQQLSDPRVKSFAYGYLGSLYEDEKRIEEAISYTDLALFAAQSGNVAESRYLWEWQMGRLKHAMDQNEQALSFYRQAIDTLSHIKDELVMGSAKSFGQIAGDVYSEFADIMLQETSKMEDGPAKQAALAQVRDTIEDMKVGELEEYLNSQCYDLGDKHQPFEGKNQTSLIVYPVILKDRIEIVTSGKGTYTQITTNVTKEQVVAAVKALRQGIEIYTSDHSYLKPAQDLYSWLIKPIEPVLEAQGTETFVIIPDRALRTIPISTFHDGKQFLVEKYALATTPGMKLTLPAPVDRKKDRVMVNGLTEAVQGFTALPGVNNELASINKSFDATIFKDGTFKLETIAKEMSSENYSIVHFATHGEFSSDHSQSFLLTHDGKLTMDRLDSTIGLRRFENNPLDLLVLSACQTASGDERSALGLAGVAVQSGARSAVATLWYINDEATADLVSDFYQELLNEKANKAEALRQAQMNMIQQERFNHPNYWAPFLMIGNWM